MRRLDDAYIGCIRGENVQLKLLLIPLERGTGLVAALFTILRARGGMKAEKQGRDAVRRASNITTKDSESLKECSRNLNLERVTM